MKEIRVDLVLRGTSFSAFCGRHGFVRQAVTQALTGGRSGPKSAELARAFVAKVRETA